MIKLEELSSIGLGMYRMYASSKNHCECVEHAVSNGVNLLDTASNYGGGESERLIGNFLNPIDRHRIFIITKAGYIQGKDIEKFNSHLSKTSTTKINQDFSYSFEKSFLKEQIQSSLIRLNSTYLDGFLIHNPEYHLSNKYFEGENFYNHLYESLLFLEELVQKSVIRYYGISCNKISSAGVSLKKILKNKKSLPNFKLLQFPFNYVENQASCEIDNKSIFDLCHENNIKTITNRPLNTKYNNKVVRIADYSKEYSSTDFQKEQLLFDDFLNMISTRLRQLGDSSSVMEFAPIAILTKNRKNIANPEALLNFVNNQLNPFLNHLQISEDHDISQIKTKLIHYWNLYSKKLITTRAKELKNKLILDGLINKNDERDLSLIACEHYLKSGANHVLVGMRKKQYVDKLKPLIM